LILYAKLSVMITSGNTFNSNIVFFQFLMKLFKWVPIQLDFRQVEDGLIFVS
jgi:hypothetical protein